MYIWLQGSSPCLPSPSFTTWVKNKLVTLVCSKGYCTTTTWENRLRIISVLHTLSGRIGKVVASHAAVARSIPAEVALIYTIPRGAQVVLPMRVGCATSQLDIPSLTPLFVAGCGWLQLGVLHWAASVHYCKYLIIDPTFCGSRFSTGRLLSIEDFTFYLYQLLDAFFWQD